MFENGSWDAFSAARVVAFATWLSRQVPPISAAAMAQLDWSAPNTARRERGAAGMRTSV